MTSIFIVLSAIAITTLALFGLARLSMWLTDRKDTTAPNNWAESGHGNPDGYGDFTCGGGGD